MERRPIGWSRNPSVFSFRAKAALLAALATVTCLSARSQLALIPVWLPGSFVLAGALSLCGTNARWRETPWLVFLNMLVTVIAWGASLWFGIFVPAWVDAPAMPTGWALALVASALAGLIGDEWLASAQTLRRLGFYGRRVRRSFFGLSPARGSVSVGRPSSSSRRSP